MLSGSIKEILATKFEAVSSEDTISSCRAKMNDMHLDSVVVLNGKYMGIVTARTVAASLLDPAKAKVKTVMIRPPTAEENSKLNDIARLMVESGTMIVPVLKNDKVIGVVQGDDIIEKAMKTDFANVKLKELMRIGVITVQSSDTVAKALGMLRYYGVNRLPVMDGTSVVGMLTMHDILSKVEVEKARQTKGKGKAIFVLRSPVSRIMSSPVISLTSKDTALDAFRLMQDRGVSSIVILNELGELEGLVTKHDILRPLASKKEQEIAKNVQLTIKLPEDEIDRGKVMKYADSLIKKYSAIISGSSLSIYIKGHREHKRGLRLMHCRLVMQGPAGSYSSIGEGWGDTQAIRMAFEGLERKLSKEKKTKGKTRVGHKTLYELLGYYY
ncbi:MAG: CBS domain-containing protein [Conexivisphaerales archaeon]